MGEEKSTHITDSIKIILNPQRLQLPFPLILPLNQPFIHLDLLLLCPGLPTVSAHCGQKVESKGYAYLVMFYTHDPVPRDDSPLPIRAYPELWMNFIFWYEFAFEDVACEEVVVHCFGNDLGDGG